ncbi:flavodoxin family protein [Acidobacteriota bacterium]
MKIKIIGLNCSPRNNSNSRLILDIALNNLKKKYQKEVEYKIIDLNSFKIEHCQACDVCGKTKDTGEYIPCIINDDVANIIDEMKAAEVILNLTSGE